MLEGLNLLLMYCIDYIVYSIYEDASMRGRKLQGNATTKPDVAHFASSSVLLWRPLPVVYALPSLS